LKFVIRLCWDLAFAATFAAMHACAVFHQRCVQELRQSSVTLHTTGRQQLTLPLL